jgi:predicted nucleic acid-binding protein
MIFVDTWAWVALADRSDPYHRAAKVQHGRLVQARQRYVTTDHVLAESITYLYDALPAVQAQTYFLRVFAGVDAGIHHLVHVSADQFRRAWDLRQKYADKPDISFVDFTSMVVMQDLGISEVFSGDQHFVQVNRGFRLLP